MYPMYALMIFIISGALHGAIDLADVPMTEDGTEVGAINVANIPVTDDGTEVGAPPDLATVKQPLLASWFSATIPDEAVQAALLNGPYGVDSRDDRGYTGLMVACDGINSSRARIFIRAGANVNAQSTEEVTKGYTPLHFVIANLNEVSWDDGLDIMKMLLDNGANPNAKNGQGDAPIHLLITLDRQENLIKVLHLLVSYGVDLNQQGKDGMTFLHHLVFIRNSRSIALIRDRYPFLLDESIKNTQGMTPLEYAKSFWFDEVVASLTQPLPDYKNLSVLAFDQSGFNSLMIGAMRGDISMAEQYINGKGNINTLSNDQLHNSALTYALRYNKLEYVKWLLEHGISLIIKNSDGDVTPQILARLYNTSLLTSCLDAIKKNPTMLNISNLKGDTAFHILVTRKAIEVIKTLVDHFKLSIDFSIRNTENETAEAVAKRIHNQPIVNLIEATYRKQERRS